MSEIIKANISDLIPDTHNGNKGTDRGGKMLQDSIKRCGAGRSLLIDRNGKLIGGNKTQQAAIANGINDVIVVRTDGTQLVAVQRTDLDLDADPKARELAWADNRVQEVSYDPDLDKLLEDINAGIDLTPYFNEDELDALLQEMEEERQAEEGSDTISSDQVEPRCQFGQVWQLGKHRLMCGDSTSNEMIDKLLGNEIPTMVWADPPYGIDIVQGKGEKGTVGGAKPFGTIGGKNKVPVREYAPVIGDDSIETAVKAVELASQYDKAIQIWWGANYFAHVLPPSSCWIVWDKENTGNFADAELAHVNHPSAVRIFKHQWNGMIKASERGEKRIHPNQKPLELFKWCVDKYGKTNDLILDLFIGSGISIIAAEELDDRSVYGCEMSPQYCELVMQRWEKISGEEAILLHDC